jgi:hypothetical protein
MVALFVTAPSERPDYRLVIAFLWHDGQNVDTEGNSDNPASRTWTELYIKNREHAGEVVDVSQHQCSPLVLRVESEQEHLVARVALFLATHCRGVVATDPAGDFLPADTLLSSVGADFDSPAAFRRVAASPFAHSSLDNPFPNLDRESMLEAKKAWRL